MPEFLVVKPIPVTLEPAAYVQITTTVYCRTYPPSMPSGEPRPFQSWPRAAADSRLDLRY